MKKILFTVVTMMISVSTSFSGSLQTQVVKRDILKEEVYQYIKRIVPEDVTEFLINVKNLPDSIVVPLGKINVNIKCNRKKKFNKTIILQLKVCVNQVCYKKITTSVKICIFKNVYVAKNNIVRHQLIRKDDIIIESREATKLIKKILSEKEQLYQCRAKRFITAGIIITKDMIESVPLINRGDIVTIVVQWQNVHASMLGKAMESGCLNEIIEVKNMSTKKRLKGEIISSKKVLIKP